MDFDPRWNDDPRDDDHRDDRRREESGRELNQGSRGVSSDPLERDARDPRDVFTRDLDLPRGPDRERVWFREHSVLLRGSESRALATTGAFRVVHADDLRDSRGQAYDPRSGELRHLREQKLVRTIPIRDGRALVVLTERGRDVLERNRHEREQHFYSGLQRPRELLHDAKVYQAYEREAERLREDGAVIHRVMLDTELKREYQQFLQEHNRGKSDSDGRPDRSPDEIARWAMDHDLPEKDGHVQFPDARIVYEDRDGREQTRDIEVETLNYRGAHASAKASSGFSRHSAAGMRVVGSRGAGGGGSRRGSGGFAFTASTNGPGRRTPDPRLAEELLR